MEMNTFEEGFFGNKKKKVAACVETLHTKRKLYTSDELRKVTTKGGGGLPPCLYLEEGKVTSEYVFRLSLNVHLKSHQMQLVWIISSFISPRLFSALLYTTKNPAKTSRTQGQITW